MEYNEFKLDMITIMNSIRTNTQKVLEPIIQTEGITMMQLYILTSISQGTVTNIGNLAKEFSMNQGNVSTVCKTMEKEGLIIRSRNKEDERIVILSLTDKGKEMVERLNNKFEHLFDVFKEVTKEKLDIIINGMKEFSELVKILSEKN